MPVSVEYQNFASGTYDWKSTDAANAPLQINSKLDTWVAAVNANAVNASKQVTVLRDPLDSTGTRTGWVIRFTDGTQPGFMLHFANTIASGNSTAGARAELFQISGWTDDTTNDGYGAIASVVSSDTGIGWYISGGQAEFIIASSTDSGEEFFILGWNMANSTSYRDVLAIFKDTNGNWAFEGDDGGGRYGIVQNTQLGSLQAITSIQSIPISSHLAKLAFIAAGTYSGGTDASDRLVYPAHPKLWMAQSTAFGFGTYYTANSRQFFGISYIDWVVETT